MSKPVARRPASSDWSSRFDSCTFNGKQKASASARLRKNVHRKAGRRRSAMPSPWIRMLRLPVMRRLLSSLRVVGLLLDNPCNQLLRYLLQSQPECRKLARRNVIGSCRIAVVEQVAIERYGVIGINLD